MPSDFLSRLLINFFLVIAFFALNVGLIRLITIKILKVSKNRKVESLQVAFWVTFVTFVFSFFMGNPLIRLVSTIMINAMFLIAVRYYYFLDFKNTVSSWLAWLIFYIVSGALISFFI